MISITNMLKHPNKPKFVYRNITYSYAKQNIEMRDKIFER